MAETLAVENTVGRHVRRTLLLAWPMILSRVGIVAMNAVDVVVLGRAGADELADYVLGLAIYDSLIGVTIGLMLGVPVLIARETGAGHDAVAGVVWRRGLVYGLALAALLCAVMQFAGRLYLAFGQEPDLAARAGAVTAVLAFSLPGLAAYYVGAATLEALHRPKVALVAILLANFGNFGLNVALVFGVGPLPALGAVGCALATAINLAVLAIGINLYAARFFPERARYGLAGRARVPATTASFREQVRLGVASGASFFMEVTAFTSMTIFIGWLGPLALAAHGVLFQFLALTFMLAYGIAGATQVRVGNAWGRGEPQAMAMAGWTGLALASLLTGSAALGYAAFPAAFLGIFTDDAAVVAAAAPVLIWVVLATVFDGGQAVMNHACRGRGDTWIPTVLHFGSYWLVMVPLAWALAFAAGRGLTGIYQAIALASVVSLGVLALRFRHLSRGTR
jgi:multidrug resistance protein, MATE family